MKDKPNHYPQNPKFVWDIFYEITQVPRPSEKEEKIRNYLINLAKETKHQFEVDQAGNVIIYCPASNGREDHETVIIQNHMDMVCDASSDKIIDFENDPLIIEVQDNFVTADRTTLGADNGLGMAMALSMLVDKSLEHPPLELLFTVAEETGLHGAKGVEAQKYLKGKKLINLDTDDWGEFFIGCAGGCDYTLEKEYNLESIKTTQKTFKLEISGLEGGHSGVKIHRQRGNAIHLMADILNRCDQLHFNIVKIEGGKTNNIIPPRSKLLFNLDSSEIEQFKNICNQSLEYWSTYLPKEDSQVKFSIEETSIEQQGLSDKDTRSLINLMTLFPHGAHKYSLDSEETLVSLSNNFAVLNLSKDNLYILTSMRYFEIRELEVLKSKIQRLAELFELNIELKNEYPNWAPKFENNKLVELSRELIKPIINKDVKVKAIHAGLECGLLLDKINDPHFEAISFGPSINDAHTVNESIEINSVFECYKFLKILLKSL